MELHQFGESRGISTILVEQIHGEATRSKSVWLKKLDPDWIGESGAGEVLSNRNLVLI